MKEEFNYNKQMPEEMTAKMQEWSLYPLGETGLNNLSGTSLPVVRMAVYWS